jgi:hypothetical protein
MTKLLAASAALNNQLTGGGLIPPPLIIMAQDRFYSRGHCIGNRLTHKNEIPFSIKLLLTKQTIN